jgi:alternate signal-mediated exported protein
MSKPRTSHKMTKVVTASALGLALLAGGSTYALWSATATANTEAAITTGDLQVTAAAPGKWMDQSDGAENVTPIENLADFRMAPSDSITLTQELNTIVVGDNISGILSIKVPNATTGAALAQSDVSIIVADAAGQRIGDAGADKLGTNGDLNVTIPNLKQTDADGELVTVIITVTLPADADNATKQQMISLGDMEITLNQGPAYVVPAAGEIF